MPLEIVVDARDLDRVGRLFGEAAAAAPEIIAADFRLAVDLIGHRADGAIRDVTPVRSGELAASTMHDVLFGGADEATIEIRQPAESQPGPGGRGGGVEYVRWVIDGRGPVDAAAGSALASVGWPHPWKHSRAADPNNYPEEAAGALSDIVDQELEAMGFTAARTIVDDL